MTKKSASTKRPTSSPVDNIVPAAFAATLILFVAGAFLPGVRAWGINVWAYVPWYLTAVLVIVAVLSFVLARRTFPIGEVEPSEPTSDNNRGRIYAAVSALVIFLWVLAFYLFRGQTHFLGDGYALLGNLAKAIPFTKSTEFGTEVVTHWLSRMFGGPSTETALLSYQLVSICAGALFVFSAAIFAARISARLRDRVLLTLGLTSGGYILLFFGYVENYALLCLAVAAFAMVGVLITRERLNRWWILVPLAGAVFLHVIAFALMPAALIVLARGSSIGRRLDRLPLGKGLLVCVLTALVVMIGFENVPAINLYLRLAFIPLVSGKFTLEGYTLLSPRHILDFLNLCILLVPGLLVILFVVTDKGVRQLFKGADFRFLAITVVSTLGAVFVLDPKLGMPRDWDLFALPGAPLMVMACLLVLRSKRKDFHPAAVLWLVIVLGLISLIPRIIIQRVPALGTKLARDYMTMDIARSRSGVAAMVQYYYDAGDSTSWRETVNYRANTFPETGVMMQARKLIDQNRVAEARQMLDWVISRDPTIPEAWAGLCICYLMTGQPDSALVAGRISEGLNPNNPAVLSNMGIAYNRLNQPDRAEKMWLRSVAIDSSFGLVGLAHLYRDRGDESRYLELITNAAMRPSTNREDIKEAVLELVKRQRFSDVTPLLNRLLTPTGDTAFVRKVLEAYPQVKLSR